MAKEASLAEREPDVRVQATTLERIALHEAAQALPGEEALNSTSAAEARVQLSHPVGARCEVSPGARRGVVRFAGCPGGIPKPLVAVELDLPEGPDRCEGGCWLDGEQYFTPSMPHASIVWKRPEEVLCGDFPEEDPFAGLSDSDEGATKD
mmetsp:Transcript_4560/g.10054  ORF Transcript_4560/g.10054 Transcript_4560/m.10054 type:complete len:151 (+) Transcript_4560:34-486(+)